MATFETLKAKIQGLIDQSNAKTGNANIDLTSAVKDLIDGYGQGGGGEIYEASSVDELPEDAPDGSVGVVENNTLVGKWLFNEQIDFSMLSPNVEGEYSYSYAFGYIGYLSGYKVEFESMLFTDLDSETPLIAYYNDSIGVYNEQAYRRVWQDDQYREVEFIDEPEGVFRDFVLTNCNRISGGKSLYLRENGEWVHLGEAGESGECELDHIIEVDTLPTDNIDTNAIYYCNGKYYRYEQLQDSPLGLRTFKEDATSGFEYTDSDRGIGVCFDIEHLYFSEFGFTLAKVSPACDYDGKKRVIAYIILDDGTELYTTFDFAEALTLPFRITNVSGLESWVADWILENTNLIEASYGWVNYTPDCNEHHIHEVEELPESAIKGDMYHLGDSYHITERQAEGGYGWSEYVNKNTVEGDSPMPIEVPTELAMNHILSLGCDAGAIYKYTGTSGTYEKGALYEVVEIDGVKSFAKLIVESGESGGDIAINGIIEQYKVNAGATVNAGDFVEFVSKYKSGIFNDTNVTYISACKLDDTRVFIVYKVSSFSYIQAVVLMIDGSTSVGSPVNISNTYINSDVTALTSNKVVIAYRNYSNFGASVVVANIDGSTIQVGEEKVLNSVAITEIKIVTLTDTKALVAYYESGSSSKKTKGIVIDVNDNTITSGTEMVFGSGSEFDVVALSESKAFFIRNDSKGYGRILTINDNTIISTSEFSTTFYTYYPLCTRVTENKVLIIYGKTYALIATINDGENTTITYGTPAQFGSLSIDGYQGSLVALNENKVLVTYGNEGKAVVLTVDGTTVTVGEEIDFDSNTTQYISLVAFSENSALVAYNNSTGAFAGLTIDGDTITVNTTESGTYVQPATSRLHNVGVAKTSGAEGETVEVYCVGEPSDTPQDDSIVGTWVLNEILNYPAGDNSALNITGSYYSAYRNEYMELNYLRLNPYGKNLQGNWLSYALQLMTDDNNHQYYYSHSISNDYSQGGVYVTLGGTGYGDYSASVENRTFTITGGTDIENERLKTWLRANATKQ